MTTLFDFQRKTTIITKVSSDLGEQFAPCLSRVLLHLFYWLLKLKAFAAALGNAKTIEIDVSGKASITSCFAELEKAGEKNPSNIHR